MQALLQLSMLLKDNASAASPIYQAISLLGPYVLSGVAVLCMFYGIILGVKFAKADDAEAKKKIQKNLINFVIGAISVFVLLLILYAIRDYV